jgi:hypothetical protein
LPVRIIMSPTCSSRFFVGRNTRSAADRTTKGLLLRGADVLPREARLAGEAYAMS